MTITYFTPVGTRIVALVNHESRHGGPRIKKGLTYTIERTLRHSDNNDYVMIENWWFLAENFRFPSTEPDEFGEVEDDD
jgi:hypothetical protein